MSRIIIWWVTWETPQLTHEATAYLNQRVDRLGVTAIARQLVPDRRIIGITATVGLVVGVVLGFISYAAGDNGIKRMTGALGAVVFAWGFLQVPIYLITLSMARANCAAWLRVIQQHGPRLIKCEFGVRNAEGMVVRSHEVFSVEEFWKCLEYAREDEAKVLTRELPVARQWEFWIRLLLLDSPAPQMTVSRALAALVASTREAPQFSDQYLVSIDIDGKVIIRRRRSGQEDHEVPLGVISVSRKG